MSITYSGTDANNRLAATNVFPYSETIEMYGFGGNDELKGAFLHSNTIYGGEGDDTISGGASVNILRGEDGNDILDSWMGDYSQLFGGSGNDSLTGGDDGNLMDGGLGIDTMRGGDGADIYIVNSMYDQILETYAPYYDNDPNPRDVVKSSVSWTLGLNLEDLILTGSATANAIGNGHANTLTGNASINVLDGKAGADTMLGGAGNDTYYVDNLGDRVFETTTTTGATNAGGTDKVISSVSFNLSAYTGVSFVESLTLSGASAISATGNAVANTLIGNSAANAINGKAGADKMLGGAGNDAYYVDNAGDRVYETTTTTSGVDAGGIDTVYSYLSAYTLGNFVENGRILSTGAANLTGNGLNNVIYAGKGSNVMAGGSGTDTLSYAYGANGTTGVKVSLATTSAQATGGSGTDTISGFERLTGSANSDSLTGNGGANLIRGGNGNDTVIGGSGNDTLYGDAGNDLLRGGTGNDILYGGAGKDIFRFDTALGTSTTPNIDTIKDFSVLDDTIQLENAIFKSFGTKTGVIGTGNFKANLTGRATDSNDYIIYETDTGKVFYDADGSGAAASVQIALVGTGLALSSADFVLV